MISFRRLFCLFAASAALVIRAHGVCAAGAGAAVSHGQFVDSSGDKQTWRVNAAHTLIWNDKPFEPVGGLFQAKSWSANSTDADWESDKLAITALKSANVTDIYVQPARGGLTAVSPSAIQRLLDFLDAEGFTYGISIDDGPRDVLNGYLVRPGAYRQVFSGDSGDLRFRIDNLVSALYFVVPDGGTDVVQSGDAIVTSDGARVNAPHLPGSYIAFLVPRKAYSADDSRRTGMPDIWDGFDSYRDSLLELFRHVRFGKGFRFFVDALQPGLSISSVDVERLVPTSVGFSTEWSAYLGRRYKSVDAVELAWGIMDRDARDIDEAARLIPLWGGGKGIEAFYDRTSRRQLKVDTARSSFWSDLSEFKAASVRGYMSDLALTLKTAVADVPVVYRSSGYSSLFANLPSDVAFDGIGIDAYGRGQDLITHTAGYVYAQAAESPRALWLPVIGTADAPPDDKRAMGYASRLSMESDFDYLRGIGARAIYVNAVHVADVTRRNLDLSEAPDQLSWLADYEQRMGSEGQSGAVSLPDVVFYPRGLRTAPPRLLDNGSWWLPTDRPSMVYDFGPSGRAYALTEGGGTVYYLYSSDGPHRIHLRIPKASRLKNMPDMSVSAWARPEWKKDVVALTIGPDPIVIRNLASLPVPEEAAPALVTEGAALVKSMRAKNILDAGRFQEELAVQSAHTNEDQPYSTVLAIEGLVQQMRQILRPYAWIEAESAVTQTFDEISDRAGASGSRVIVVDSRPIGAPPAIATYTVDVKEDATFELWVAASPNAPLSFRLDEQPMLDSAALPQIVGAPYSDGSLVWMRFGAATLPKGTHKLEMRANGPAVVDTILLMHGGEFVPDGPNPPPVNP